MFISINYENSATTHEMLIEMDDVNLKEAINVANLLYPSIRDCRWCVSNERWQQWRQKRQIQTATAEAAEEASPRLDHFSSAPKLRPSWGTRVKCLSAVDPGAPAMLSALPWPPLPLPWPWPPASLLCCCYCPALTHRWLSSGVEPSSHVVCFLPHLMIALWVRFLHLHRYQFSSWSTVEFALH